MLADEENRHRVSALWVVEHLNLVSLLHEVADVARSDPARNVRQRALRVIRDMAAGHLDHQRDAG
jgi:hypothetical protein